MSRLRIGHIGLALVATSLCIGCQALTAAFPGIGGPGTDPATTATQATGTLTLRLRVPPEALPGYSTATIPGGTATLTLTLANPARIGPNRVINVPLVGGQTLYTVPIPALPVGDGYTLEAEAKNGSGTRLAYANRLESGASDPVLNQPSTSNPYALPPQAFTVKSGANDVGLGLRILPVAGNTQADAPGTLNGTAWVDAGYLRTLTVTSANAVGAGYVATLSLDTAALVGAGKLRADMNDLHVLYWDGSRYVELTRAIESPNTAASTIRFRTQKAIAAVGSDANYRLAYGNNLAGQAPSDPGQVYDWYEPFEYGIAKLEARGWNAIRGTAAATVSAGIGRSGSMALQIDSTTGDLTKDLFFAYAFPANFALRAWFYDDMDLSRNDWIAPTPGDDVFNAIGIYTSALPTNVYHSRPNTSIWLASAVNRTVGWHQFEFRRYNNTMAYLVDGTQMTTMADARTLTTIFVRGGMNASFTAVARWDDLSIRPYVSPEPAVALGAEAAL